MIPNDYARCINNECKLKETCKRWLQNEIDVKNENPDTKIVVVMRFTWNIYNRCENYIKHEK